MVFDKPLKASVELTFNKAPFMKDLLKVVTNDFLKALSKKYL